MIPISKTSYHLHRIEPQEFWDHLDKITFGQYFSPEFGYTPMYYGNFENTFAGRKEDDRFCVYLYRPISRGFRTEVLIKGKVQPSQNGGMIISCSYELQFMSSAVLLLVSFGIVGYFYLLGNILLGYAIVMLILFLFSIVSYFNYKQARRTFLEKIREMEGESENPSP